MVRSIREMLGLQAQAGILAVVHAALAAANIQLAGRIELDARLIGDDFHRTAALRIHHERGSAHRQALAQHEVVIVAARVLELLVVLQLVQTSANQQTAAQIERGAGNGHIIAGRHQAFIDDRGHRIGVDMQNLIADSAMVMASQVKIGVVGHVAVGRLVGSRLVADAQVIILAPAVGDGHVQRARIVFFTIGADVVNLQRILILQPFHLILPLHEQCG